MDKHELRLYIEHCALPTLFFEHKEKFCLQKSSGKRESFFLQNCFSGQLILTNSPVGLGHRLAQATYLRSALASSFRLSQITHRFWARRITACLHI